MAKWRRENQSQEGAWTLKKSDLRDSNRETESGAKSQEGESVREEKRKDSDFKDKRETTGWPS